MPWVSVRGSLSSVTIFFLKSVLFIVLFINVCGILAFRTKCFRDTFSYQLEKIIIMWNITRFFRFILVVHIWCACVFVRSVNNFFTRNTTLQYEYDEIVLFFFFVAFWILLVGRGGHFMIFLVVSLPNNKIERLKRYYYSIIYGN